MRPLPWIVRLGLFAVGFGFLATFSTAFSSTLAVGFAFFGPCARFAIAGFGLLELGLELLGLEPPRLLPPELFITSFNLLRQLDLMISNLQR